MLACNILYFIDNTLMRHFLHSWSLVFQAMTMQMWYVYTLQFLLVSQEYKDLSYAIYTVPWRHYVQLRQIKSDLVCPGMSGLLIEVVKEWT